MAIVSGKTTTTDWSGVELVGANFEANLETFVTNFNEVAGSDGEVTQATSTVVRFSPTVGGTVTIRGSGLTGDNPVATSVVWADGDNGFTALGRLAVDLEGEEVSGKITSATTRTADLSLTMTGSLTLQGDELSGTVTKLTWTDGDAVFSATGTITFDALGNVSGSVKSFSAKLADGSSLTITGVSVPVEGLEAVDTVAELLAMLPANLPGDDTISFANGTQLPGGGAGNDTYIVTASGQTASEQADQGIDTVRVAYDTGSNPEEIDLASFANIENVRIDGKGLFSVEGSAADNRLSGNGSANTLLGGAGNDTLSGGSGNDTLSGGEGADAMSGGRGNDTFIVDDAGDVVTEKKDEGTDTVESSVDHTLRANVERLTLTGTDAISGTGNSLANRLVGNEAANTLTGKGGNDTYEVQDVEDVVVEAAGAGTDTVIASVDYTLSANVERLVLAGDGLSGTGNAGANRITGTEGDDVLDGGAGNDTLIGRGGDDLYKVDRAGDVITEAADMGEDTVEASASYRLGANVDNLKLVAGAAGALNATGNGLDNEITGNELDNKLNGGGGSDVLAGGAGNDQFVFASKPNDATNVDTISDFTPGADRLAFDNDVFTKLGAKGGLVASRFASGEGMVEAAEASQRLIYDTSNGDLYYDANGLTEGATKIATLTGAPALTAADIVVLE